ncbi:MAG: N-acetyltransferase [Chloroflexota bacterium]
MKQEVNFQVVRLTDHHQPAQIEQFIAMMGRMYDYHANLHPDWQPKTDWQKGTTNWIQNAAGGNEWFFALLYSSLDEALQKAAGYILAGFHYEAPLFIQNRYGYIVDLWIEPEQRGNGAAQLLLEAAFVFFREQGTPRVQLEVMVNNERGKEFWQKAGFEPFEIVLRKDI